MSILLPLLWSCFFWNAFAFQDANNPLAATALIVPSQVDLGQTAELKIQLQLLDGFHVYEESLQVSVVEPEGFLISKTTITPVTDFYDKNSKKNRRGVQKEATLATVIEAPKKWQKIPTGKLQVGLTYQACSDTFCLFPKTINIDLQDVIVKPTPKAWLSYLDSKNSLLQILRESFWLGLLLVFLGGILTSFSPCIFPMIPITLAVLGQNAHKKTRLQNFLTSVFYVLGISLTYSFLGLFVASTGALFGSTLSNPYILGVICLLLLLMAFSQFGLFEIRTPDFIANHLISKKTDQNYVGAFFSGLISGVVASPCVGPVLVALLSYVATLNSPVLGFVYLFTYALGLGMIFLSLGLSNQLLSKLPTSGPWLEVVKNLLGLLLLVGFYYYLHLLIPQNLFVMSLGLGLIGFALYSGALLGWADLRPAEKIRKSGMLAVMSLGLVIIFDVLVNNAQVHTLNSSEGTSPALSEATPKDSADASLNWQNLTDESLQAALANGKPTIVDFWASWCEACLRLKSETFPDDIVASRLKQYNLLHFDATKDSPALNKYRDRFDISGLPHILFFDRQGKPHEDLVLSEFEKPAAFLKRLDTLENQSP